LARDGLQKRKLETLSDDRGEGQEFTRARAKLFGALLNRNLVTWNRTSIKTRLQKNLHLLTLEGRPAPPIVATDWPGNVRELVHALSRACLQCARRGGDRIESRDLAIATATPEEKPALHTATASS
jgi:transcriptional regulator of acetoin/glycerol metabolism